MAINPQILGTGWSFPFRFNPIGGVRSLIGVAEASSITKVQMAIQQILGTKVGSRVIDRDFGSDLRGLVFEPIDELTQANLRIATIGAISRWEKRVQILGVDISIARVKEGVLEAFIQFQIITTQVEGNLVYPFYLTPDMRVQNQLTIPPLQSPT